MADSNPQWHSRAAKAPSPPNANNPLSPASGGPNPVSFQTNVNRAKTKRWLEAKQYSYDGGDWGDEENNQEGPPAAPRAPYASHRPGSSSELSSGRLSGLAYGSDESRASPSAEAQRNSGGDQKAPAFIRPADIYKRMREERSSTDSGYPAEAPQSAAQPGGVAGSGDAANPATTRAPSLIGLPEVKRISAFGTDFLHGGDSSFQQKPSPGSQETSLQHKPSEASSHGLRSVVHQAFDVPETPNSTAGSVGRSNSDGTSSVSPIMSNRGWTDDKTPTIPEEPAESNTPTGATAEPPSFKPGHRRDVSLPSPDNSPLKRPTVTDHTAPASDHAEVSSISTVQPVDADSSSQRTSMLKPSTSAEKDFVAPLKFGSNGSAGTEGNRGDIPPIAPVGHSPQDADNDRLREEIIRSLSREGSQEPEHQPQPQGATGDSIPRQYEKFWGDGAGHSVPSPHQGSNVLVSDSHPHWTSPHSMGSQDPYVANQASSGEAPPVAAEPPTKPRMARRFSWESSSEEEEELPGNVSSHPPLGAALAIQEPEPIPDDSTPPALTGAPREPPMADGEVSDNQRPEKPRLSIIPPVAENGNPPEQIAGPVDGSSSQGAPMLANVGRLDIDESKLQGFREILKITAPGERIRAFDHTRDQFAALNTGLNHWIEFTVHDHPEHADLVQGTQSLSADFARTSPTSRRFPKLTSFGNLASKEENAPPSAHNRRPSGHVGTIQNVEQRGKDFLHTAGAFSGKAGVAAKGFFAKGRSKFRPSGDKGQSRSFRKSLQVPGFSSESNASNGNFSFRNPVSFGGLPVSRHDRNVSSPAVLPDARDTGDGEPPGNGSKYSGSLEPLRTRNNVNDGSIDRRASQGFAGRSHAARDFEREMSAALGLSPTESRPQQNYEKTASNDRPVTEKSLPLLPGRPSDGPAPADAARSSSLNLNTSETTIRPVSLEEVKPSTPPKDLPPRNPPPGVPPKDLPSNDLPPRNNPLKNQSNQDSKPLPQSSHSQRQPSVSTLGADERMASRPAEEEDDTPPSPIQLPSQEAETPVYVKSLSLATASSTSLPSVEENTAGFTPMNPRCQSSAQILESKRRSISGMPGIQSPLRNEVRYSPGTRSSMMSWSSFGRRSTNSKGTRPGTPANELSHGAAGDSKMDKLKSFGKRRRASVGDLLSGIQENIQGGFQGIPEGSKRKRTFSRISGLFNRSHEVQHESKQDGRSRPNLSNPPFNGHTQSSAAQHGRLETNRASAQKALPAMPVLESESISVTPSFARESRQRASMPLPPSASSPSLASGRFYSQVRSTDTLSASQHTRAKSQPMMLAAPLSPIAPSLSAKSGSPSPHMHDLEERKSQEQDSRLSQYRDLPSEQQELGQTDQAPYTESPNSNVNSPSQDYPGIPAPTESTTTKEPPTPSTLSTHPHRNNEARVLNETPEPVELAMTRDDSSEEIIMSSTAYPGQEWTPMHM